MLLFALFFAACSTEPPTETSVDTDVAAAPTAADYCEVTADAFCSYYLRCGRMAVDSEAACKVAFLETCNAAYEPHYIALEQAGLLALSADGVDACVAHLGAVTCEAQIFDLDGGCSGVWQGLAPAGADCGLGIESFVCDDASTCVIGLDFCGSCQPTVPVDAACGPDARCEATASCVSGVCVARALPGDACGDAKPCVSGASCSSGVCAGPTIVAAGEACDQVRRCPYKSACAGGVCVEAALLGEDCGGAVTCASGWCDAGTCVALGDGGATCTSGSQCFSGACDGTCVALPGVCFDDA